MKQALLLIGALSTNIAFAGTPPVGDYAAVFESEWGMDLSLKSNHSVVLKVSSWEAGDEDHVRVKKYVGRWAQDGEAVSVSFKQGNVAFTYSPQLSFEQFGRQGSAPGLVPVSTSFDSMLLTSNLWLKSELGKIKW